MNRLRASARLLRLVWHIVQGAWTVYRTFHRLSPAQKDARIQAWSLRLLDILAIQLVVQGDVRQPGPLLLACNHISWLDITVLHAARGCRFVAKSEIQHWPVIGPLASAAGTLYIERESRRDALRVVHHMAECLQNQEVLAVFPEGTTGDGSTLLPFHANLLQAAIATHTPVQPVALQFVDATTGTMSFAPCYIGDDTLLRSLWRTACTPRLVADLRFAPPLAPHNQTRRELAQAVRVAIEALREAKVGF
jgi:1-acyl-sn-glycerol-3-phosphate acyltransferase